MNARRVPVSVVVLAVAAILIAVCFIWAKAVDRIVPDYCDAGRPVDINHAGPVTCPMDLRSPGQS